MRVLQTDRPLCHYRACIGPCHWVTMFMPSGDLAHSFAAMTSVPVAQLGHKKPQKVWKRGGQTRPPEAPCALGSGTLCSASRIPRSFSK